MGIVINVYSSEHAEKEYVELEGATKGADTDLAACRVIKAETERQYTLGLAYPAMAADKAVAADGHIDFVGEAALEKTAWDWMTKHRSIGLFHKSGTDGHATVVESYIYRGPDWKVEADGETYTIRKGDWLLGCVWDDFGWGLIKSGLIRGFSPQGSARRTTPTAERLAELRS
jgi:hypothetical protein